MAPNNKQPGGNAPGTRPTRSRTKKMLLLIVEVIAIIGILASAAQMWSVRQELQQDLLVAKEAEAALRTGEQTTQPSEDEGWTKDPQDVPAEPTVPLPEDASDTEHDERSSLLPSPSVRSPKLVRDLLESQWGRLVSHIHMLRGE